MHRPLDLDLSGSLSATPLPEAIALLITTITWLEQLPWPKETAGRREIHGRRETLDEHSNHVADVLRENLARRRLINRLKLRVEELKAREREELAQSVPSETEPQDL